MNTECGRGIRAMGKVLLLEWFALNTPPFLKLMEMYFMTISDLECTRIIRAHVTWKGMKMDL